MVVAETVQTDMEQLLRKIYELYADYVLKNPFYSLEMPIRCELFDTNLQSLLEQVEKTGITNIWTIVIIYFIDLIFNYSIINLNKIYQNRCLIHLHSYIYMLMSFSSFYKCTLGQSWPARMAKLIVHTSVLWGSRIWRLTSVGIWRDSSPCNGK